MNLTIDPKIAERLELISKATGAEIPDVLAEAVTAYFRKLVTEGKIASAEALSSLSSDAPETDYSLEDDKDLRSAKKWGLTDKERDSFGKAQAKNADKAEQGDPKAQNVMGTYYESGNGVEKDYDRAIYWYTLAAEQRNSNAQYHLAVLYNKIKDNPLKAYYWFEAARLCGFNITHIHQDYILRLTERLSARQIKTAREAAAKKFGGNS